MAIATSPPGPKGTLSTGHLRPFRRDPLTFLMRSAEQYGDLVHFHVGRQRFFLINHPDYIKDVLVTHHRNFHKGRGLERAKLLLRLLKYF